LRRKKMPSKSWTVERPVGKGEYKEINIVFFDVDCDAWYVRKSLIDHDGYPSDIVICDRDKAKLEGENITIGFCDHCGCRLTAPASMEKGYCLACVHWRPEKESDAEGQ
jgi:hypothetical protein